MRASNDSLGGAADLVRVQRLEYHYCSNPELSSGSCGQVRLNIISKLDGVNQVIGTAPHMGAREHTRSLTCTRTPQSRAQTNALVSANTQARVRSRRARQKHAPRACRPRAAAPHCKRTCFESDRSLCCG